MGFLELASSASAWRGYEYFNNKYVIAHIQQSTTEIIGTVCGSYQNHYDVFIDLEHPRRSKCNCPHADGKRIICKHMVALYFSAFPEEAQKYYDNTIVYEEEEEKRQEELERKLMNYVHKLKKSELEELLLRVLYEGPEWQYDKFIRDYIE